MRLVRLLLSNTILRVNVNGTMSIEFQSLLGAFQGDSTCWWSCDLSFRIHLVIDIDRPNPPITELGLPLDTSYVDDVDFNDEEEENLKTILPLATEILNDWNLFVTTKINSRLHSCVLS